MDAHGVTPHSSAGQVLRVARFLPLSYANGPGARAVLWVQGCTLACPGCFNSQMQASDGGTLVPVSTLTERILTLGDTVEGISISGGEPLQQWEPLLALLQRVREAATLSVLVFTGYTWDEIRVRGDAEAFLACVDVLVAGRYDATQSLGRGLRGSANQTIHLLTSRYTQADIDAVPPSEVIITETGDVIVSGVAPPHFTPQC